MCKILVTSTGIHDGKSTVCKRLAKEKSDSGERILLIDMDFMESNRIGQGNGIVDYIYSKGRIHADIINENNYNVLLPSKVKKYRFFNRREVQLFNILLAEFDKEYSTIIIDMPPLQFSYEVIFLCPFCDEILVVNSGRSDVNYSINALKQAGFQAKVVDNFF